MAYMDRIREQTARHVYGLVDAFDLDGLVPEELLGVAARIAAEEGTIRTAIDLLRDRVGHDVHAMSASDVAVVAATIALYMLELVDDIDVHAVVRERATRIVRAARASEPSP